MKIKLFSLQKFPLWIFLLLIIPTSGFAQSKIILKGKVIDESNQPLPGASVNETGTTNTVITNSNGEFSITVSKPSGALKVAFISYESQTINYTGTAPLTIVLKSSVTELSQVVVVGYGSQRKANLTGAVASVNMTDIQGLPISNTASALQGRLPGVTISSFNNQPGKNDPQIRIRGIGTLNNNDPLVVIDGVPTDVSALGDLSPYDIQSISVLKDAASASIYGVRAANGVILVTTRRGETGKTKVQFRENLSWQKPLVKPDYMDAYTWATSYNDFLTETGSTPVYTPEMLQKIKDQSDPDHFANTDWFDVIYKTAPMQNHYVSFTGGSNVSKYLISTEYQHQDGILVNTAAKRFQLRANLDNTITKNIHFGLNLRGQKQKIHEPISAADGVGSGDGGINRQLSGFTRPTVPAIYSFGQYGYTDGSPLIQIKNPLQDLNEQQFDTDEYRLEGKGFLEIKFLKDFSFTSSLAINYINSKEIQFNPSLDRYGPDNTIIIAKSPNSLYNSTKTFSNYVNENLLRYGKTIGKHNIKVLLGHTLQHDQTDNFSAKVVNLPSNSIRVIGASSEQPDNDGSKSALSLQSFLGRINYTFDDKYLIELNARVDGTSRLPNSEQYPVFPSFSAGWLVSREAFLRNNKWISLLKLRGSYGRLGNQQIGNYAFVQNYDLNQNYVLNGALTPGVAINSLANSNIRWETTTMADIGLDAEFFNGRLALTGDYFNKDATNILFTTPIPYTLGVLSAPPQNAAAVNNKGFEFNLTLNNKIAEFNYLIGFNGSFIKNKVLSLANQSKVISGNTILIPGSPIGSYFGYIAKGIIRTPEQLASAATGFGSIPLRVGDIAYEDLNKDGKISVDDRTIIGNPFPKFSYGINLGCNYKGFDLGVFLQGIQGINRRFTNLSSIGVREQKLNVWTDRFTLTNTDGVLPRFGNNANNDLYSSYGASNSYGFRNASYIRLKNLELGYTLPKKLLSRLSMAQFRISATAVNLHTWSKVKDYDVEKDVSDDRSLGYLNTKNFALGLSVTF